MAHANLRKGAPRTTHSGLTAQSYDYRKRRRLSMPKVSVIERIDTLIYALYGLTLEEIAIVEGKN